MHKQKESLNIYRKNQSNSGLIKYRNIKCVLKTN